MLQRRKLGAKLPGDEPATGLGENAVRYHANYSINSITTSNANPRRRDLDEAGITPEAVRTLAKQNDESLDAFYERMSKWISETIDNDTHQDRWRSLLSLAISISERGGVFQPVMLIASPQASQAEIVAGERRFLGSLLIGADGVNAMVHPSNRDSIYDTIAENLQHNQMSFAGDVDGFAKIQEFTGKKLSVTDIEKLSGYHYSRGRAYVIRTALAMDADDPIWIRLMDGEFPNAYALDQAIKERKAKAKAEAEVGEKTAQASVETDAGDEQTKGGKRSKPSKSQPSEADTETASQWDRLRRVVNILNTQKGSPVSPDDVNAIDSISKLADIVEAISK